MLVLFIVPACLVVALAIYGIARAFGLLPDFDTDRSRTSGGSATFTGWPRFGGGSGASMMERLEAVPPGCLISAIVAMALWIALWGVVLVLGLRLVAG